jgi:hypothetical protein
MHAGYHTLSGAAADIPVNEPKPVVSFSPVVLPDSGRIVDLQLRVTAPSTGDALPIILLSHCHGRSNSLSSLEGYAPLAEFEAAHGFAVLQPTHLSLAFLGLRGPEGHGDVLARQGGRHGADPRQPRPRRGVEASRRRPRRSRGPWTGRA